MESLARDNLLDIAFGLNEAVLHQNRWERSLQNMADIFNGSFATFELINKKNGQHIQHFDSSDIEIRDEYIRHYMPKNPRIAFGERPEAPKILHDILMIDERDMDRHEFYADFLRPFDLRYFLSFKAYETIDQIGVFTIQKNAIQGAATNEELHAIRYLAPTLTRVADLQVQYGNLFSRMHDLDGLMTMTSDGVVTLDGNGRINEMNAIAGDIMGASDGIACANGRLVCSHSSVQIKFEKLLSNMSDMPFDAQNCILVPRLSGLPPYEIRIQKIAQNHQKTSQNGSRWFGQATNSFVAFIFDPVTISSIGIDEIKDGFGLTSAEANVALSIAMGKTAQDIAIQSNVSLPTIRTHIQRILHKMSVNKQADIARIIARYL